MIPVPGTDTSNLDALGLDENPSFFSLTFLFHRNFPVEADVKGKMQEGYHTRNGMMMMVIIIMIMIMIMLMMMMTMMMMMMMMRMMMMLVMMMMRMKMSGST